ncbi:hypothetical protein ACHAQA_001361 [Verticillium albo-atrum]
MAEVSTNTPIKEEPHSSPTRSTTDPTSRKRKASPAGNENEDATKRTKIESPENPTNSARRESHGSATSRPGSRDVHHDAPESRGRRGAPVSKDEEKKRGKRLFGGLLGTLNQPGAGTHHKKRREIEQRQQERAQKHKLEAEKRSAERLSRITQVRKAQQINFDEKVYYQPWKFSRAQEDIIDDQIADAKATIAREVEEFALRRDQRDGSRGHSRPSTSRDDRVVPEAADSSAPASVPSTALAAAPEHASVPAPEPVAASADSTNISSNPEAKSALDHDVQQHDEPGDVVVEAEEDTVMY